MKRNNATSNDHFMILGCLNFRELTGVLQMVVGTLTTFTTSWVLICYALSMIVGAYTLENEAEQWSSSDPKRPTTLWFLLLKTSRPTLCKLSSGSLRIFTTFYDFTDVCLVCDGDGLHPSRWSGTRMYSTTLHADCSFIMTRELLFHFDIRTILWLSLS